MASILFLQTQLILIGVLINFNMEETREKPIAPQKHFTILF
jgi:hypothetical protein